MKIPALFSLLVLATIAGCGAADGSPEEIPSSEQSAGSDTGALRTEATHPSLDGAATATWLTIYHPPQGPRRNGRLNGEGSVGALLQALDFLTDEQARRVNCPREPRVESPVRARLGRPGSSDHVRFEDSQQRRLATLRVDCEGRGEWELDGQYLRGRTVRIRPEFWAAFDEGQVAGEAEGP